MKTKKRKPKTIKQRLDDLEAIVNRLSPIVNKHEDQYFGDAYHLMVKYTNLVKGVDARMTIMGERFEKICNMLTWTNQRQLKAVKEARLK